MAIDVFHPQHGGEAHQSALAPSTRPFSVMAEDTQSKEPRGFTVADIVMN